MENIFRKLIVLFNKIFKGNIAAHLVLIILLILQSYAPGWGQDKLKRQIITKRAFDSILVHKRFDRLRGIDSVVAIHPPHEPPPVASTVHLKKDKDFVRTGESVGFNSELSEPDKEAVYIYTINYQEPLASGTGISHVEHIFDEPGVFIISVLVRTRNRMLSDSLMVEVQKLADSVPPVQTYNLTLNVRNPQSKVGDVLTFTALTNAGKDDLEYWFNFGDDTIIYKSNQNIVTHIYSRPDYYTASVRLGIGNQMLPLSSSALIIIEQSLQPYVRLEVLNSPALRNDAITLIANANIKGEFTYEFFLGEQFRPIRTGRNLIRFTYPEEGTYKVFVKLYQGEREIAESETEEIIIQPIGLKSDWWKYVTAILIIGLAGYIIRKNIIKPGLGLTFHPYPDQGLQAIKDLENFEINYEINFNPNPENSEYNLKSEEDNFIKSKKVQ